MGTQHVASSLPAYARLSSLLSELSGSSLSSDFQRTTFPPVTLLQKALEFCIQREKKPLASNKDIGLKVLLAPVRPFLPAGYAECCNEHK